MKALRTLAILSLPFSGAMDPAVNNGSTCNALSIGDDDELMGALTMGDPELVNDLADVGAIPRRAAYGYGRRPSRPASTQQLPMRRLVPTVPGAPAIGLRLQPLGFTTVAFTAASGTALPATTRPQRPFKGKRLSVDFTRTGASATGLITITEISVGANNQMPSRNPIGAAAFSPLSVDSNVELAACTTSLDITVGYAISAAPTMTDRVDIATTLFGETVGG